MIDRYDIDLIGDLTTDDRETVDRDLVLEENPKLQSALEDASGEVDVALLAGGRYSPAQLQNLEGHSGSHLKRIVCALTMAALYQRRPEAADAESIKRLTEDAREAIKSLRRGENVFGLPQAIEAGKVTVTGPTAIDIQNRNDLTARMHRFFPTAATRLPRGR
jgi:phage gp36-like protein